MVKKTKIIKNTVSLYAMNIAKMILPLIVFPYLTRVLSKDTYGMVSYVKAVMQYMQLIIDFGFILSGTKDIVTAKNDQKQLLQEVSSVFWAKIFLGGAAGCVLLVVTMFVPMLRENILFTLLSFVPVFLTCFLFDYLFRGLEQMHVITVRYVVMKVVSIVLTFVFVRSDADLMWIPILDIIGSLIAIALVFFELYKRKLLIAWTSLVSVFHKIKDSAVYFASDMATSAFTALNTLLLGIYCSAPDVADWSICMQLIGAAQSLYTPIINAIYPEMVKTKRISIVKRTAKIFVPIVLLGCVFTLVVAEYALLIVSGEQYTSAAPLLRGLTPVLFFGFLAMLFGWPTLGAIGRVKENSATTIFSALFQILGLVLLIVIGQFKLLYIALLRSLTEVLLFFSRYLIYKKHKNEFCK